MAGRLTAERLHDGLLFRFYLLVELFFALDNLFRPTGGALDLTFLKRAFAAFDEKALRRLQESPAPFFLSLPAILGAA